MNDVKTLNQQIAPAKKESRAKKFIRAFNKAAVIVALSASLALNGCATTRLLTCNSEKDCEEKALDYFMVKHTEYWEKNCKKDSTPCSWSNENVESVLSEILNLKNKIEERNGSSYDDFINKWSDKVGSSDVFMEYAKYLYWVLGSLGFGYESISKELSGKNEDRAWLFRLTMEIGMLRNAAERLKKNVAKEVVEHIESTLEEIDKFEKTTLKKLIGLYGPEAVYNYRINIEKLRIHDEETGYTKLKKRK